MSEKPEDASIWERRAREEADAAAREAGRICGHGSARTAEEADQPLTEAGGGVAEGFEQAEQDLIEHASHGDRAPDLSQEGLDPDVEEQEEAVQRGSRDHAHSTQRRDECQTG